MYDRERGTRTVMTSRYGSAIRPVLSPDGRHLVYGTRHAAQTGLRIRDLETGEERWLAYPVQRDDQESTAELDALPGYAFTPDGSEQVRLANEALDHVRSELSDYVPLVHLKLLFEPDSAGLFGSRVADYDFDTLAADPEVVNAVGLSRRMLVAVARNHADPLQELGAEHTARS